MSIRLETPQAAVDWLRARVLGRLVVDSRLISPGDGLIAWPGAAVDGRQFVPQALAAGAAACLIERQDVESFNFDNDSVACYDGLKAATGPIAAAWHEHPSEQLDVFAVTGTNGKTSTAWWLAQVLSGLDATQEQPVGLIGTLGVGLLRGKDAPQLESIGGLTTPDPVELQRAFRRFVRAGALACAIEASSIGLAEHRLDATRIQVALFTNLSQDHLDYHGSMSVYWQAKQRLFDWPGLQAAVINVDDAYGVELAKSLQARSSADVWTVARTRPARLQAQRIEQSADALCFDVVCADDGDVQTVETGLLGLYNVSNLLGVIAALRARGVPLLKAARACAALTPVPGRLQRVPAPLGHPMVLVDFAHTPDALTQVLSTLQPIARQRGGQLHCVFGCGGDRDRSKRAPMAAAVEQHADRVVLTSDNPRSENPHAIIEQARQGLQQPDRVRVEPDRAQAIRRVVQEAASADVICIAGKGHETTQEIGGRKFAFSDAAVAAEALALRPVAQHFGSGVGVVGCGAAA
ncbi:MAG: UDP-N-acetylmuramoyl-L-alanyl-D-glutamate--2,6-diaminopimelate ligase [Burkholderiaceae bacterium]